MKPSRFALLAALAVLAQAQGAQADPASEAAAAKLLRSLADDPLGLRMFFRDMPKGGDLHNHLSGSIFAEEMLQWAAEAGYCADPAGTAIVAPPCAPERGIKALGEQEPEAFARLVDALSTRGLQQGVGRDGISGHDQFFATFDRFGAISSPSVARSLASVRRTAADERVSYLELTHNPAALIAHTLAGPDVPLDAAGLAARYDAEIAAAGPILDAAIAELDSDEAEARRRLDCAAPTPDPACAVTVRYLAWGWRDLPPAQAFRSLVLAFALADRDPRFLGINIVQPEDWVIALRDYDLHMAMIRFLAARYPGVHRTLHAGELAFGLVPPAALRDHVRKAIDAGAQRIGHGTAIAYEDDAPETMARMARAGIAVEINLTSNDVILGVRGRDHPLDLYRRMGVPVVLSTDDAGILRTDMTNEYVRAAREHGLDYAQLKQIARDSIARSFLAGASLWRPGQAAVPVATCAPARTTAACRAFIANSEKAGLQAALEDAFDRFEAELPNRFPRGATATGTEGPEARERSAR